MPENDINLWLKFNELMRECLKILAINASTLKTAPSGLVENAWVVKKLHTFHTCIEMFY